MDVLVNNVTQPVFIPFFEGLFESELWKSNSQTLKCKISSEKISTEDGLLVEAIKTIAQSKKIRRHH